MLKLDHYFSICPIYYGRGLGVKQSIVMAGLFSGDDLYHINNQIQDAIVEEHAKSMGLNVEKVKL